MTPDFSDSYGSDVLSNNPHREGPSAIRPHSTRVHLEVGMVLGGVAGSWVGVVIRVEKSGGVHLARLEDRRGQTCSSPLGAGFQFGERLIIAFPPRPTSMEQVKNASGLATARGRVLTNPGLIAAPKSAARVAGTSRIWAEGRHGAELVQHVWSDDLAEAGVVAQLLEGVGKLKEVLEVFGPSNWVRAGVLADRLVSESKESRIAEAVTRRWWEGALVLDHPHVGIWQAVKPSRLGLEVRPQIERGTNIRYGTLEAFGWSHENQVDVVIGWEQILSRVRSYKDLEPTLPGRVKEFIDFVTAPGLS